MAKKIKEQVKYDPSLTDLQRVNRLFSFKGQIVPKYTICLFTVMWLFILIVLAGSASMPFSDIFFDPADESDRGTVFVFSQFMMIIISFILFISWSYTNFGFSPGQSDADESNVTVAKLLSVLPATRLLAQKRDFRRYTYIVLSTNCLNLLTINVCAVFSDKLQPVRGCIGVSTLLCLCVLILLYYLFFVPSTGSKPGKGRGTAFAVMYFAYLGIIMSGDSWIPKVVNGNAFFEAFSGVFGIVLVVLSAVGIICYEKLYVERMLVGAAWFDYQKKEGRLER